MSLEPQWAPPDPKALSPEVCVGWELDKLNCPGHQAPAVGPRAGLFHPQCFFIYTSAWVDDSHLSGSAAGHTSLREQRRMERTG